MICGQMAGQNPILIAEMDSLGLITPTPYTMILMNIVKGGRTPPQKSKDNPNRGVHAKNHHPKSNNKAVHPPHLR